MTPYNRYAALTITEMGSAGSFMATRSVAVMALLLWPLLEVCAQLPQTKPDLSTRTPEEREQIESACSVQKLVGGPAAYYQCLRDQLATLAREPSKPDLSTRTPEEREQIESACSVQKLVGGPAAYYQCLRGQLATLAREPTKPDLSTRTPEEREQMESACSVQKLVGGPAAYYQCLRSQLATLVREPSKPDLSARTPEEREQIESACSVQKLVGGPAAYYQCVRGQLAALGRPSPSVPRSSPPPAPKTAPESIFSARDPRQATPQFRWPLWSAGLGRPLPPALKTVLEPALLFNRAAPSVYAVLAAATREQLQAELDVSQGSAVAVSEHALITNCHVVENAGFIVVVQNDKVAEATLVKSSPDSDRCILTVDKKVLSSAPGVRTYRSLAVGERVYTIGTPKGLEQTLGEGLISGLRESGRTKLIQTSAPISPGSSGGGLFDANGNLIGITTFVLRETQSLNFAIAAEEYWH